MLCPQCRSVIENDSRFCPNCGCAIPQPVPSAPMKIRSAASKRWSSAIWIMLLLAFACELIRVIEYFREGWFYYFGVREFMYYALPLVILLGNTILFCTSTRDTPHWTAIPAMIQFSCYFVMNAVSGAFQMIELSYTWIWIVDLLLQFSAIHIYFIATLTRPANKALAIIHCVLCGHLLLLQLLANYGYFAAAPSQAFISVLSMVLTMAAFSFAAFQIKPRDRAEE